MPFGNRTGPCGAGPMTGRAAGYCAGYGVPGHTNPVPGRGFGRGGPGRGWGRGFGRGRGRVRGFGWDPSVWGGPYGSDPAAYVLPDALSYRPEDEMTALKDQAKYFEKALEDIKKRIQEMEGGTTVD